MASSSKAGPAVTLRGVCPRDVRTRAPADGSFFLTATTGAACLALHGRLRSPRRGARPGVGQGPTAAAAWAPLRTPEWETQSRASRLCPDDEHARRGTCRSVTRAQWAGGRDWPGGCGRDPEGDVSRGLPRQCHRPAVVVPPLCGVSPEGEPGEGHAPWGPARVPAFSITFEVNHCLRPGRPEQAGARLASGANEQGQACLVLGRETAWEDPVLQA